MGIDLKCALLAVLVAISLVSTSAQRAELLLSEPQDFLRTAGGSFARWSNIRAVRDANIVPTRITLRQRGLYLPEYTNAAVINYVEEGEGYVGLVSGYSSGEGPRVRRIRRGDVLAFPRGIAAWAYNSGSSELRILGLDETSVGPNQGDYTVSTITVLSHSKQVSRCLQELKRKT